MATKGRGLNEVPSGMGNRGGTGNIVCGVNVVLCCYSCLFSKWNGVER